MCIVSNSRACMCMYIETASVLCANIVLLLRFIAQFLITSGERVCLLWKNEKEGHHSQSSFHCISFVAPQLPFIPSLSFRVPRVRTRYTLSNVVLLSKSLKNARCSHRMPTHRMLYTRSALYVTRWLAQPSYTTDRRSVIVGEIVKEFVKWYGHVRINAVKCFVGEFDAYVVGINDLRWTTHTVCHDCMCAIIGHIHNYRWCFIVAIFHLALFGVSYRTAQNISNK